MKDEAALPEKARVELELDPAGRESTGWEYAAPVSHVGVRGATLTLRGVIRRKRAPERVQIVSPVNEMPARPVHDGTRQAQGPGMQREASQDLGAPIGRDETVVLRGGDDVAACHLCCPGAQLKDGRPAQ